jgi:cytochrome c oxidase subunit 2
MGVQAQPAANGDRDEAELPTLVLPVDKEVKINLQSRDVIHSFWVIDFLYKKDMYPHRDSNSWSFIPTREGTYAGKCAELCGEYHSMMLFNVEVVSEQEYEDYLDSLRESGQTGDINQAYDRLQNAPGTGAVTDDSGEGSH